MLIQKLFKLMPFQRGKGGSRVIELLTYVESLMWKE